VRSEQRIGTTAGARSLPSMAVFSPDLSLFRARQWQQPRTGRGRCALRRSARGYVPPRSAARVRRPTVAVSPNFGSRPLLHPLAHSARIMDILARRALATAPTTGHEQGTALTR
jgi:hypothetical protein